MSQSIENLKFFLKEMFQFNENDLDFGIYKIYNLKRKQIESFIDGEEENDLKPTIEKILKEVNLENQKTDSIELYNFLKGLNQDKLLEDPEGNYQQLELFIGTEQDADKKAKLVETLNNLSKSEGLTDELKDKIYNHILGFFQMYYSNGDFGYNDRSRDIYKVPYEADYNGSDTMFHWKHKGSLYIKTGTSFNAIKFELAGNKIEFRLETNTESENEEVARNNNKDSQLKHYRLDRVEKVEGVYQVIFNLSDTSTSKVEIFKAIYNEIAPKTNIDNYLTFEKDGKQKTVFVDLTKDFDKVQNGQIKGLSALRQKKKKVADSVKKNFERGTNLYDEKEKKFLDETLAQLYTLDQKLNSFYIGNDADYFIHENLLEFLSNEKQRYVKNYIFDDLQSIYDGKLDNTTLLIAKAFDKVSSRIIEFLSAIEDFQKHLFTKKKKVVESEYCITLDYIDEKHYPEILKNKAQLQEWRDLFSLEVKTIKDLKDNPTLVLDTKFFRDKGTNKLKDQILAAIDDLDENTNGILINSENFSALELLTFKYHNKINTIYIDPPYNTGDDGFAYKDSFRHSSWLSMMENRLQIAKDLLNDKGVIFVNIGEQEYFRLKPLLELIFNDNSISTLIWKKKKQPSFLSQVGTMTDYIFVYAKNKSLIKKLSIEKAGDGTRRVDNASNPISEMLVSKGIESKGLKDGVIKKGIYVNKSMSTEYLDDVTIVDGYTSNDFRVKANFRTKQEEIDKFCKLKLLYITEKFSFRRYPTDEELERNKSISNLLTSWGDNQDSSKEKESLYSDLGDFKYPKPSLLVENLVKSTMDDSALVLDYFGGSGTTAHSVLNLNQIEGNRKYLLVEMGGYFDQVLTKRIARRVYSKDWEHCKPKSKDGLKTHIFKYFKLEQYEDILDGLQVMEIEQPDSLPLKYLYKPEENSLDSTLDIFTPFDNKVKYGQPSQEGYIDLVETYNYLQGYFIKSIKTYYLNKKYYKVVETTNGELVVWREIKVNEDDSEQVIEIASNYNDIHTIEVNAEFANLKLDKNNLLKVDDNEIELKIITKEVFNQ